MAGYGTYDELQKHGMDFPALLKRKSVEEECYGMNSDFTSSKKLFRSVSSVSTASSCAEPYEVCFYLKEHLLKV